MANDYSKLVQFFTGSALPAVENLKANGLYFITSTDAKGQHVGKLYRGNVLIAETNDNNAIADIQGSITAINTALDTKATKDELAEHIRAYELLLKLAQDNSAAITAIKDGETIDSFADVEAALAAAKTARDQVLLDAKAYADGKDAAIQAAQDQADKGVADAAKAQEAADKAQGEVDALEEYVGTIPTVDDEGKPLAAKDVVSYIEYRTQDIASGTAMSAITERLTTAEGKIEVIEGKIEDVKETVGADIAAAVLAEENRAKGVEKELADAVDAIEDDYLTSADKEELQGNIDDVSEILSAVKEDVDTFFKEADFSESAKDTLKELQEYMNSDASAASEMLASINKNKEDIATNAGDIDKLEGRMDTAESDIDALEGRATGLEGRMTTAEADIDAVEGRATTLEGKMTTAEGLIAGLQTQVGEGNVQDRIDQAVADLKIGDYAKQADLEAEVARATKAEGENAAAIALKADQTALEAEVERAEGVEATLIAALSWQTV